MDFCVEHVVEDLVELVILQASSYELDDLDRFPVEFIKEGFEVDLLEICVEKFYGVAVDIGVVEGLLSSHCLHSLYVFVPLLLAVYDRSLPYLNFPLTFFTLKLMFFQEVNFIFLIREE